MFETGDQDNFHELDRLHDRIKDYIEAQRSAGAISQASVYFRDMSNGHWIGVNENEFYSPASLFKVVLMIAYLRSAEGNQNLLSTELPLVGTSDNDRYYSSTVELVRGRAYTTQELIVDMITQSGNDSTKVLFDYIDKAVLERTYGDFEFPLPSATSTEEVSPRLYAQLFRVLYGSTYLPRDWSEQVLSLLSQTNFKRGLVAGVPSDIVVAHKFGEWTDIAPTGETTRQLHDCGIIYNQDRPYLLCVMTRGAEFPRLESVIVDISRLVYAEAQLLKH